MRLLTYAALGNGMKGIRYYIHDDKLPLVGYSKSPSLLAEVKKVNADIKKREPILSPALPISSRIIGDRQRGVLQYTLWSGDEGVLVVARNLDYTTDHKPNDLGRKPRFKFTPKTNVELAVRKPDWWKEKSSGKIQVLDPLTQEVIPFKEDAQTIRIPLAKLDLGRILWIPTPGAK